MTLPKKIHFKLQNKQTDPKTSTVHPNDLYAKKPTLVYVLQPNQNRTHNQRIVIINHYNNANEKNSKSQHLLYQG